MKKVKIFDIHYDTDNQEIDLPETLYMEFDNNVDEEEMLDEISNYISDHTGFCHKRFDYSFV